MKTTVVILGGGPAGSVTALSLAAHGISCVLVEREQFPRYHIGESMTGECGKVLRRLGLAEKIDQLRCRTKRGVNVYGKSNVAFHVPVMERTSNGSLVPVSTWQVQRSDLDHLLLEEAREKDCVTVIQAKATQVIIDGDSNDTVKGVIVKTDDDTIEIHADFVVDASGQSTFLANRGVTSKKMPGRYDKQIALYSQVTGARRDKGDHSGNTLIFYRTANHWAWLIPVDEDTVSIGVVVPVSYFRDSSLDKEDFFLSQWNLHPELEERLKHAELSESVRTSSNYSYSTEKYTGPGFLCVGDSHRFIDPVFSFGLHFAVHEAGFAADAIRDCLEKPDTSIQRLEAYTALCNRGMNAVEELIQAFWRFPLQFSIAVHSYHTEDMTDLFAGRVYGETPSEGLLALQNLNRSSHEKEANSARKQKDTDSGRTQVISPPWLTELVEQLLGDVLEATESRIDLSCSITSLGLDSITATEFIDRLGKRLNITLSPTLFFEYDNPISFVETIAQRYRKEIALVDMRVGVSAGSQSKPVPSRRARLERVLRERRGARLESAPEQISLQKHNKEKLLSIEELWENASSIIDAGAPLLAESPTKESVLDKMTSVIVRRPGGLAIEFVSGGKGSPILLIGGLGYNAHILSAQISVLAERYRVWIYHPPGHGRSELGDSEISLASIVEDLNFSLDAIGIEKEIPVLGWSLGGLIALSLAMDQPSRFSSMIVASSSARTLAKKSRFLFDEVFKIQSNTDFADILEPAASLSTELLHIFSRTLSDVDITEYLGSLNVPILLISGSEDQYTSPEYVQEMHKLIPRSKFMEVRGAGHFPHLTHAPQFNDEMLTFLDLQEA